MLASVSVELAGALSRVMTAGVPVGGQPALSSLSGAPASVTRTTIVRLFS